jgi:hypothetical protein
MQRIEDLSNQTGAYSNKEFAIALPAFRHMLDTFTFKMLRLYHRGRLVHGGVNKTMLIMYRMSNE